MTLKFSPRQRQTIGLQSLDEFINFCRSITLQELGSNHKLILNEFGRRFDLPHDSVCLMIVRPSSAPDLNARHDVWHWGGYSPDRVDQYRLVPERRWNKGCHCNSFIINGETDPAFFGAIVPLFTKSLIVTPNGYRVEDGGVAPTWTDRPVYGLSGEEVEINLGHVLREFLRLRPMDKPLRIAIHSEYDHEFRTLFADGLPTEINALSEINLRTRHSQLLFRLNVDGGQLRYFVYDVAAQAGISVSFGDSKKSLVLMAQFKEGQQRLACPLIVGSEEAKRGLAKYEQLLGKCEW